MSSETVLKARDVGKRYEIYEVPHHRLLQTMLRGRKKFYKEFWALRDVSFEMKRGECLGIIGRNGSGKSTLLKIVAGALAPTTGSVEVEGKVAALLELGSGFNPDFTGRENVYMNGAVLGMSRAEIDRKFNDIAAFADIGKFIDQPVRYYSSGMQVRLAFAVATAARPDILVVDETLAVGDAAFRRKCYQVIETFRGQGTSIIFVSHAVDAVKRVCEGAIFLDRGRVAMTGNAKDVCDAYEKHLFGSRAVPSPDGEAVLPEGWMDPALSVSSIEKQYGDGGASITDIHLELDDGIRANVIPEGARFFVNYDAVFLKQCRAVKFGMMIKTVDGISVYGTQTQDPNAPPDFEEGRRMSVRFSLDCNLVPGTYYLNAGLTHQIDGEQKFLNRRVDCLIFRVVSSRGPVAGGCANLFAKPSVECVSTKDEECSKVG